MDKKNEKKLGRIVSGYLLIGSLILVFYYVWGILDRILNNLNM